VPAALRAVRPGGTVVCGGIHMSDIPSFPYDILWGERTVRSVANLTRKDGREFLELAPGFPSTPRHAISTRGRQSRPRPTCAPGRFRGAAVIVPVRGG
jgi:propanol-preferring alcohol dehydrogenase